jgi:hypothetical protein
MERPTLGPGRSRTYDQGPFWHFGSLRAFPLLYDANPGLSPNWASFKAADSIGANVERNLPRTGWPSVAMASQYAVRLTLLLAVSLLCVLREAPLRPAPTPLEPR